MSASSSTSPASPPLSPPLPWWGRIETVWLLLPTICTLLYALCQSIGPNDLWYHVRAGEFLVRLGHIPNQNGMSTGVPLDTPYYYQSWIGEGILYQTVKATGLAGIQILRASCLGLAWGVVSFTAFRVLRRESGVAALPAARAAALATVWGFVMSSNNIDIRPQTFSVLLFGIWLSVLNTFFAAPTAARAKASGITLVGLAMLWANTHGAFVISLVSLGAWTLGLAVSGQKVSARRGALVLMLCMIAVCFNPRGLGLYVYLQELSSNAVGQKYIQEWQSPGFNEWHNVVFFLSAPLCLVAVWLEWRRNRRLTPWLWVVGALWLMGLRDMRSITWFALVCPFLLASAISALMAPSKHPDSVRAPQPPARATAYLNVGVLCFLLLLPLGVLPALKAQWPWPAEFRARFAPTPQRVFPGDPPLLLERTTPVETVEFLVQNPPRKKVFTDMVCGSYMTWASHPQVLPLCDPRIELFPTAFWEDYMRLSSGPADAAAELEKRGFSDALLDSDLEAPLVRRLQAAHWKVMARGGKTILLRIS